LDKLLSLPGLKVNAYDENKDTALIVAVDTGNLEAVEKLLAHPKINVNLKNADGYSALIRAAKIGDIAIVRALLKAPGINVNATNLDGESALTAAMERGHTDIFVELLKTPGVKINQIERESGNNLLMKAAQAGKADLIPAILENTSIGVNDTNKHGETALSIAAGHGRLSFVDKLLEMPEVRSDIEQLNKVLVSTLKHAKYRIASRLLDIPGVNVNAETELGTTALKLAVRSNDEELFEKVMSRPDLNVNAGRTGVSPIFHAVLEGHTQMAKRLMDIEGIDLSVQHENYPNLLIAAMSGRCADFELIDRILEIPGMDTFVRSASGHVLGLALKSGDSHVLDRVLKLPGLEINEASPSGSVALIRAVKTGDTELLERILRMPGINVNAKRADAATALIVASDEGYADMVKRLLKVPNINVNAKDNDGDTALIAAAYRGETEIVDDLLGMKDIDVNARNKRRETALITVAKTISYGDDEEDHLKIFNRLLNTPGIDIKAKDSRGKNVVDYAFESENEDLVKILHDKKLITREIMVDKVRSALRQKGIRDISALKDAELFKLSEMIHSIKEGNSNASSNFRAFMAFRCAGAQLKDEIAEVASHGFDIAGTNVTAVWHTIKLDKKATIAKVDPEALFRSLVLSINGSRDPQAEREAKSRIEGILKTDRSSERIAKAYGEWGRIRGIERGIGKSIADAFKRVDKGTGTMADALDIFRAGAQAHGKGEGKEAIMQLIGLAETALATGQVSSGKRIMAYTVQDDSNVLMIDHGKVGCCAFQPYHSWKGLNYAMDPSIKLVQFASVNDKLRSLDELNPIGVAICVLGVTDNGKKIFFVDSMEGGQEFSQSVISAGKEKEVLRALKTVARASGATEIWFSPATSIVHNQTPQDFVRSLENKGAVKRDYIEFRTLCRDDQYLEGPQASGRTHIYALKSKV
jgi:ankyrin repeat protein